MRERGGGRRERGEEVDERDGGRKKERKPLGELYMRGTTN